MSFQECFLDCDIAKTVKLDIVNPREVVPLKLGSAVRAGVYICTLYWWFSLGGEGGMVRTRLLLQSPETVGSCQKGYECHCETTIIPL